MPPRPRRPLAPALRALPWLAVLLAAGTAARAATPLADSTVADAWTLTNGLRVVTRDVPRASSVAITVAVASGRDADPPDRPALARLAAEVQFMGAAGDIPSRSRREMESLRPLGWSIRVTSRATLLSEVASPAQFPGILRQVATRLRGVSVDDSVLSRARASVRRDLGEELFGDPGLGLYYQAREYALGADSRSIIGRATARDLDAVTARDLEARLHAVFVPANAVLAVAGDLRGLDLHALVRREFGDLPAGVPPPPAPPVPLRASVHTLARRGLTRPAGIVAVAAPALTDSLHPQFLMSLLLIGQYLHQTWGDDPRLPTRFSYSILDEPDLVRIFPDPAPDSTGPGAYTLGLEVALSRLSEMLIPPSQFEVLRANTEWLLGGPMPSGVLDEVRRQGAALNTLAGSIATRELMGGEAFWSAYRRRFSLRYNPQLPGWAGYLTRRMRQIVVVFTP